MKFSEFLNNKIRPINEAGGEIDALAGGVAGLMLKTFMEIKTVTLNLAKYKIYYSQQKRAENQKEIGLAKIDVLKAQKVAEFEENYNDQTSNQAKNMDATRRKSFRAAREGNLSDAKAEFGKKYTNMRTEFEKKAEVQVNKYSEKVNELKDPNTDIAKGIWTERKAVTKAELDRKFGDQQIDAVAKIKESGGMDPEDAAAWVAKEKEMITKEIEKSKKRIQNAKDRIKRDQEELDNRIANASADEKEAALKIKEFQQSMQEFIAAVEKVNSYLNENYSREYELLDKNYYPSYLNEADEDDEDGVSAEKQEEFKKAKAEAREAGKKMNRAHAAITKGVLKKGLKLNDEDAEAWLDTIKSEKQELVDELRAAKFDVEDDVDIEEPKQDEKPAEKEPEQAEKPATQEPEQGEKSAEKEPEKEIKPSRDKEEYEKEETKEKLKKAEAALQKAKDEGASEEKIKGIESQIEKMKKKLNDSLEIFNYSRINEELDLLIEEINGLTSSNKKIFTFEQFLKSR